MYRISLSLIYELAKALGKSEDEVRQFLEALRQRLPLAIDVDPPFVRYLDVKIEGVRSTLEAEINGLRMMMEQGFRRTEERDQALRREMEQGFLQARERDEELCREINERFEALRREMDERFKALRREMERG
jgi:flagellar biosynthesis/type III secretory pathway protein FliH